jgi:hypothetical protein
VTKEKQKLMNIKGTDEKYELKQLPTSTSMQLLEYNPTRNNVEGIYNVYLTTPPNQGEHLRMPKSRVSLPHNLP